MTTRARTLVGLPMPATFALAPGAAQAANTQAVAVTVSWQVQDVVLILTATTLKKGASVTDSWAASPVVGLDPVNAADSSSDDQTSYVSTVTIRLASLAPDTTYTFSYAVSMSAAQDRWLGTGSLTLTTGPDPSVPPNSGVTRPEI